MCGIIAVIAKHGDMEKAREAMLEQYENQYSRGTRGFGLIEVTPKSTRIRRATEPVKALIDITRSTAGILLFHHRTPTSTENTLATTHPMLVSNPELESDWYICHNGTIRNADELKKKHEALGYIYTTKHKSNTHYESAYWDKFNDSEALAIELARYLEHKTKEVEWNGAAAFIGVKVNKKTGKPGLITYGKGEGNPLQMKETPDNLIIASDIPGENVYEHDEKKVSILTLKAINDPSKWNKDSKDNTPLMDMAFTSELAIAKPLVTITHHVGYHDVTKIRPLGLLAAGRDENGVKTGNAIVHYTDETCGPSEEDPTPRQRAFFKMADKTMAKVASVIANIFENLSDGELDDRDVQEYMNEIESIIRARFAGATRTRFHLDKVEEEQMTTEMGNQMSDKTEEEPIDSAITRMTGDTRENPNRNSAWDNGY